MHIHIQNIQVKVKHQGHGDKVKVIRNVTKYTDSPWVRLGLKGDFVYGTDNLTTLLKLTKVG